MRGADRVFLLLALSALTMAVGGGCSGPKTNRTARTPRPEIEVAEVRDSHLFADDLKSLTAARLALKDAQTFPVPLSLGDVSLAQPFSQPDLKRISAGMNTRISTVNTRVEANIQDREQRTAELQIRQMREQLAPELEEQLVDSDKKLAADLVKAQLQGAAERQKLQMDIVLMEAKDRNTPGDVKKGEDEIARKQTDLRKSREAVVSRVTTLRAQHNGELQKMRDAHETRISDSEKHLLGEADQRAKQQADARKVQSTEAMMAFISKLQMPEPSKHLPLSSVRPGITAGVVAPYSVHTSLNQKVADLWRKIDSDAVSSGVLASISFAKPLGGLQKNAANRRAKRLVSRQL